MADQEPKVTPENSGDDTRTRKTIKFKSPSAAASPLTAADLKAPTDPLAGRDTDTGNLEVLEDTQTRKTVKLKPLSATESRPISMAQLTPKAPVADPLKGRDSDTGALEMMADTQTRKTVKLKPLGASPTIKLGPEGAGSSTNTRKVVVLKPATSAAATIKLPETADPAKETVVLPRPEMPESAPAPADPSKETVVLPQPGAEPAAEVSDETVKVAKVPGASPRPAIGKPTAVKTTAGATPVTPEAAEQAESDDATVKLARPARPAKPAKPAKPETPAAEAKPEPEVKAAEPEAKAAEPEAKPKLNLGKTGPAAAAAESEEAEETEAEEEGLSYQEVMAGERPSKLYLALAAVSLIFLLLGAITTTVQYLNIHADQNIELPVLADLGK